jgi:hypothetical protein
MKQKSLAEQGFSLLSLNIPEAGLEPARPCGHWILNPKTITVFIALTSFIVILL